VLSPFRCLAMNKKIQEIRKRIKRLLLLAREKNAVLRDRLFVANEELMQRPEAMLADSSSSGE
jgi:hypothetical protein